jgi:hypothetical protein
VLVKASVASAAATSRNKASLIVMLQR